MNVTVADCLKLPTLREAQLIAGAKGTDRAVSSVSVLDMLGSLSLGSMRH